MINISIANLFDEIFVFYKKKRTIGLKKNC